MLSSLNDEVESVLRDFHILNPHDPALCQRVVDLTSKWHKHLQEIEQWRYVNYFLV